MLNLRADVQAEAKAGLASQISMAQAERLLADTTMFTISSLHRDKKYVFGFSDIYEDPESQQPVVWILLGMLLFLWLVGCILMCVCLCCNKDDRFFGQGEKKEEERDQEEKTKLIKEEPAEIIEE